MNFNDPIVIVSACRTPLGAFLGSLAASSATDLGAAAVKAAAIVPPDEVFMGCVLPAGLGQAPARQAALKAGLPESVPATTISKVCGSGMAAIIRAHDAVAAGSLDVVLAGGMESMSNAPYLLDKARTGLRFGHAKMQDHMLLDGLEDAYDKGKSMGVFADETAAKLQISRVEQDAFAAASVARARAANFTAEIVPLGEVTQDEGPQKAKPEKIPQLKPAFTPDGTVTAASSSSISDGAAALLLMKKSEATKRGLKILAEIRAHATHAQKPAEFTLAPIGAIEKVLKKSGWKAGDVDLFEINEAFAVVTLAAMKALNLPHEKVNVKGGACALGHPIGASGARIVVTLLHALKERGLKKGVAALCIGGGEATAVAVEVTGG